MPPNDKILNKKWTLEDFPVRTWEGAPNREDFKDNWFSNFKSSPVIIDDWAVNTVEHYYQAMKAILQTDFEKVLRAYTPGQAKRLGRKVNMRPDWEYIKFDTMFRALTAKCAAYPEFLKELQKQNEIVEWNTWGDQTWGATLNGEGRNALGVQLMFIRDNWK